MVGVSARARLNRHRPPVLTPVSGNRYPVTGGKAAVSVTPVDSPHTGALLDRIPARTATVRIIGLGYVGPPPARAFAHAGCRVIGFDIDAAKVQKLNAGRSFIKQIPDKIVAAMRGAGFATADNFARLNEPDAILICVPTPLTEAREPDLTYVVNSANAVAGRLRPGNSSSSKARPTPARRAASCSRY
jgi:hypothetical protein